MRSSITLVVRSMRARMSPKEPKVKANDIGKILEEPRSLRGHGRDVLGWVLDSIVRDYMAP